MIQQLREYAGVTPLTTRDLVGDARLLMNYGVATESVIPSLKLLANVSGGSADRLNHLSLAFGQMSASGRLMGQDLNQMVQSGFTPIPLIMARTGESFIEVKKRMEEGLVSVHEVNLALIETARDGDKMAQASKTLEGRWSTLKDESEMLASSIGEKLIPALTTHVRILTQGVKEAAAYATSIALVASVSSNSDTMFGRFANYLTGMKTALDAAAGVAERMGPSASLAAAELDKLEQKELAAIEAAKKMQEEIAGKKWADDLAKSLRNPVEVAEQQIQKISDAFIAGHISLENYARAIANIGEEFSKASKNKSDFSKVDIQGTAAVTRYTAAGFSAVSSAQAATAQLTRQIANATESSADTLRSLLDHFRNQDSVLVPVGVR